MKIQRGGIRLNSKALANPLRRLLSDETMLYAKAKDAEWNVEGPGFYDTHIRRLDAMIDSVAERIGPTGDSALATIGSHVSSTRIAQKMGCENCSHGFVKDLLAEHESIIVILCEHIKPFADEFSDLVTSNFIAGLLERHRKIAGVLRAHIKP